MNLKTLAIVFSALFAVTVVVFMAAMGWELIQLRKEVAALSGPAPRSTRAPAKTREEMGRELQTSFENDGNDSSWSKEGTVAKLAHVLPAGVTLDAIECRTKMCRLETTSESPQQFTAFVRAAFVDPESRVLGPGNTQSFPLGAPSGRPPAFVSYVSRDGPLRPTP